MTQAWYVFRTASQREIYTTHLLRQYGLDVICLMRPELKRAHRRHKVASVPKRQPLPALRPYVFIDCAPRMAWQRIHLCPVDVRPVSIEGKPPRPLSAAGVSYITDPKRGLFRDTDTPPAFGGPADGPDYAVGDLVMIYGAGMDGMRGKVINLSDKEAEVLLPLFGSERAVKIPFASAVKAA